MRVGERAFAILASGWRNGAAGAGPDAAGGTTVGTKQGRYLFDHSWEREGERLAGIQAMFDPGTHHVLTTLGLTEGWRCWEAGAGAGSIACWLAEQVGPDGSVLATDISTALLERKPVPTNLEVRRHDVVADPPPAAGFDLVHCRLVLEHLPGRLEALANMAGALAPGGLLVVEDMDWRSAGAVSRDGLALSVLLRAARAVMTAHGYDARFGRRLPAHLSRLGLADVGGEGRVLALVGDSPLARQALPTLERMRSLVLDSEVVGRVPGLARLATVPLSKVEGLLADPSFAFVAPILMAAWGRKP